MKTCRCMIAIACAATVSCASDVGSEEAEVDLGVAVNALNQCSTEDRRELNNHVFYANVAITEAVGNYSIHHPMAQRYFGVNQQESNIRALLGDMLDISSGRIEFSCDDGSGGCSNPATVFWVAGDAWRTGDRTLHVCERRWWDPNLVNGVDRDWGVSKTGAIVHEIAHFAGVPDDGTGESNALQVAQTYGGYYTFRYADSYRFFVMRQNDP